MANALHWVDDGSSPGVTAPARPLRRRAPPDVILLDLNLPKKDAGSAGRIKEDRSSKRIGGGLT